MLTVGSLFAGVGGFDLGFHRAGHRCLWQVEIDDAARGVLARHFPDAERFADVRDCGAHNLASVDVITFGSPCQDLSVAGRRAGFDGERSGLFFEAVRIIRELRPRYAIWENVPGALSSNGGRDFGAALDALADAGALDLAWRVLDAQWFGVAQRRRRVFLVADFGGERAASVLFEPAGGGRDTPPRRAAGERVTGPIADSSGERGWSSSVDVQMWTEVPSVASTLGSHTSFRGDLDGHGAYIPTVAGAESTRYGKGINTTADDGAVPAYTFDWQKGNDVTNARPSTMNLAEEQSLTLPASRTIAVAFAENQQGQTRLMETANSLNSGGGKPGQGYPAVMQSMAVRRLTPTECEKLQGFPPGWTDGQSDSARYRQLGNAVCVNVSEWIARRLAAI